MWISGFWVEFPVLSWLCSMQNLVPYLITVTLCMRFSLWILAFTWRTSKKKHSLYVSVCLGSTQDIRPWRFHIFVKQLLQILNIHQLQEGFWLKAVVADSATVSAVFSLKYQKSLNLACIDCIYFPFRFTLTVKKQPCSLVQCLLSQAAPSSVVLQV